MLSKTRSNFFAFLLLSVSYLSAQNSDQRNFEEGSLTWDNFEAIPDSNDMAGALTATQMEYALNTQGNNKFVDVAVNCFMIKKQSWVKPTRKTDELLKHEQGHFNITEKYARMLRKFILTEKLEYKTYRSIISKHYKELSSAMLKEHKLYDKETRLSNDKTKQAEWDQQLEKELKKLEKYSLKTFTVKVKPA